METPIGRGEFQSNPTLSVYMIFSTEGTYCIRSNVPIDHAQYQGWNIGVEHRNIFHPTDQFDWSVSRAYVINIYICTCYSTGRSDIRDIFHELQV